MSILSKIKEFFNKNIECGEEIDNEIVYLYPAKRGHSVGVNIVVKTGFVACFVCGNKVTDVLFPGKHKVNGSVIPGVYKKLKLGVPNKKGNLPKKFKCDIYFVNTQIISDFEFESNIPFVFKTEEIGKVKGYVGGICKFQICDANTLLNYYLSEQPRIKSANLIYEVSSYIGNNASRLIEKSELKFFDLLSKPNDVYAVVNAEIEDDVSGLGIAVKEVKLTNLNLPKKVQKRMNEYLEQKNKEKNNEEEFLSENDIKSIYNPDEKIETLDILQDLENQSDANTLNVDNVVMQRRTTNTNVLFDRSEPLSDLINDIKTESVVQENNENSETKELDAESVLNNNKDYKKVCKFCGELIDANFNYCPKCGYKQE